MTYSFVVRKLKNCTWEITCKNVLRCDPWWAPWKWYRKDRTFRTDVGFVWYHYPSGWEVSVQDNKYLDKVLNAYKRQEEWKKLNDSKTDNK